VKNMDPKVELLRRIPGLTGYRDRYLAQVATMMDELDYQPGEMLTREGMPGGQAFLIVEGEAEVTLRGEQLATVGAGEFVGEMALLDHSPRSATVTAVTPMRVLVMDPGSFWNLLGQAPVARRVAIDLARRLRELQSSPAYGAGDPR
jgi:CRP/FNR family transcriptional regulator, cyclic AMP receptor protein